MFAESENPALNVKASVGVYLKIILKLTSFEKFVSVLSFQVR